MKKIIIIIFVFGLLFPYQASSLEKSDQGQENKNINLQKKEILIDHYYKEGTILYIRREYKIASYMFQQVMTLDSNYRKAKEYLNKASEKYNKINKYYCDGINFVAKAEWLKALDKFKKTLMLNPRFEDAHPYVKICYDNLGAINNNFNIKPELTTSKKKTIFIESKSNATTSLLANGIQKYRYQDYKGAIKIWNEVLKFDPDNTQAKKYIKRAEYQLDNKKKK